MKESRRVCDSGSDNRAAGTKGFGWRFSSLSPRAYTSGFYLNPPGTCFRFFDRRTP